MLIHAIGMAQKVFQVSDEIHQRLKILAIHENKRLSDVVDEVLKVGLEHYELRNQKPKPPAERIVPHPFSDQI